MPLNRRDFMKLFGVSVAALFLSRCRRQSAAPTEDVQPTCYAPTAPPDIIPAVTTVPSARERLRLDWLRFGELAQSSLNDTENKLGRELVAGHRAALDELVASGEISAPVADLVQEAYGAAVYHIWRSSTPITCYIVMGPYYSPTSANVLIQQAAVLNQVAEGGTVDPTTLAKARAALEHDLSFYALSEEEVQHLYSQLLEDNQKTGQPMPSFEELSLKLTPEAKEATQFITDLLTGK
jgi:hypothetical protein